MTLITRRFGKSLIFKSANGHSACYTDLHATCTAPAVELLLFSSKLNKKNFHVTISNILWRQISKRYKHNECLRHNYNFHCRIFGWQQGMQVMIGFVFPVVVAGLLYRSTSPPSESSSRTKSRNGASTGSRRATKTSCCDVKCDDFPLQKCTARILMLYCALTSAGIYVPFLLLVGTFVV